LVFFLVGFVGFGRLVGENSGFVCVEESGRVCWDFGRFWQICVCSVSTEWVFCFVVP
jgi:hypothetical protein